MTNLGERYLEQSIIVESAEGTWVQATRAADGAHVIGLALSGQTAPKAAEAAEAARAVASKGSPFVAQLAEASSTSLVWGPVGPKRLSELVKQRGGLTVDRVIDAAHQIAQALAAAEAVGVPHHDLHPRAIGVLDGGDAGMLVRVAGFGAAKLLPLYSTTKKNDAFHGSPEYMAPEVCGGKGADHRSDIYALGIIMYEMVTVKPPFLSNNINTTIKRQIYEKPLPLHLVKPGVEHISDFEKVVLRAVEKDPKKRFQSAADLVAALESLRDELFPTLVFSDPAQVQARAEERAAAPDAGPGDFIPAAAEDITSRKHGTLVFSGLGQTFDLDEEEDRTAAPAVAAQAAPGKPGTQIFSGLGDLIDEDDDEDDDARAHPALAGGVAADEPESFAVASKPAVVADSGEPPGETEPTSIVVVGHAAPIEEERTAVVPEPEGVRRQTMMFDPRVGMDVRAAAASQLPLADEVEEAEDALASAAPVEEPATPKRTMLFEAVKGEAPQAEPASTAGAPEVGADRTQVDVRHAEMVSWAANQPPRQRAKSEEMEAWFVDASTDAGEPEDPYTLAEGKKSTRKFMVVMGVVTVVLVVLVAMFLDTGSDDPKPRKGAGAPPAKIGQEGQAASSGAGAVVPDAPTQTPEQIQASGLVKLGDDALGRQELGGARVLYENALKLDPASDGAKAGLEKVAELEAQQAAAADAGAAAEPDAGGGSQGGAVAGAEAAAAEAAAAEAAAAKAASEAAAAAAAEEAAAKRAADEAAARRAADEAASAGAAEAAAAKRAAEEAAAAKAAEAAAAKKVAEEAAAAKAAEAAAAKAAEAAAAKKAAEEAAAKKAAQGTSEKGVVDEVAAKKAAEAAAAKKAAAAEAKRLAAEEAAAKKAAEAAKKAAEGSTKAGSAEAAKNPEEESAKLVKLGIGAMKSGNNPLALKYFNKAKTLNPANAMIQKYIEKASQ